MKWLLITTSRRTAQCLDSNVGDEFAMFGVKRLVEAVDSQAEFDFLDKESTADWDAKHPHSRAIICGMPLFWSNDNQTCSEIYWWDYIWDSYVGNIKRKILPLGIGHVLVGAPHDEQKYRDAIKFVTDKSWHVVVREPIYGQPEDWIQSVCPSAFCNLGKGNRHSHKFCNLMPGGGHFGYLTGDSKRWDDEQVHGISDLLQSSGFVFIAHTSNEVEHAKSLGWQDSRIQLFNSAKEYLDAYADTAMYFGNRMHGAAVCAAAGAKTWAITHDSRLGMVQRLGGKATRTIGVTAKEVAYWLKTASPAMTMPDYNPRFQYDKMVRLMKLFAYANGG